MAQDMLSLGIAGTVEQSWQQMGQARMDAMDAKRAANAHKVDKVAEDFEAMFLNEMLGMMFENEDNQLYGDSFSADINRSMMMDEYAKIIAKSGGIGIADTIRQHLLQLQEVK